MAVDDSTIESAAYWLRTAADYITELHGRLGLQSTTFADSMRIEALALDGKMEAEHYERLERINRDWQARMEQSSE